MPEPLVCIPALNASTTIGGLVERSRGEGLDVLVVDDGSDDATATNAERAGARVLRHPRNLGKGAALRSAFAFALEHSYPAVITLDADGQHVPSDIPKFLRTWRESSADLIIGSRRHLFGGMVRRRRLANLFSARTISFAAGVPVGDPQSGFRLYGGRVLREVKFQGNRFDAESEIIVLAGRLGLTLLEIPIELGFVDGLSTSHYRPLMDTLRIAARVVRTRFRPSPPAPPR